MKKFIRRYPGFAMLTMGCSIFFSVLLLLLLILSEQRTDRILRSEISRAEAVIAADFREMAEICENGDITDRTRCLLLTARASSAADAVAGSGYSEEVKHRITALLNSIQSRLEADEGFPTEEEVQFLRSWDVLCVDDVPCFSSPETGLKEANTRKKPISYKERNRAAETANRLFGVSGTLREVKAGNRLVFTCKNAYAVMDGVLCCPLEAVISFPRPAEVRGEADVKKEAVLFLETFYPKWLRRSLSVVEEEESDVGYMVVFSGEAGTIRIGMDKATGKLSWVKADLQESAVR